MRGFYTMEETNLELQGPVLFQNRAFASVGEQYLYRYGHQPILILGCIGCEIRRPAAYLGQH